jgi:hypothetical protein
MSIAHFVFFICISGSTVAAILLSPLGKDLFSLTYTPRRVAITSIVNATLASFIGPYIFDLEMSLEVIAVGLAIGTFSGMWVVSVFRKVEREERIHKANLSRIINSKRQEIYRETARLQTELNQAFNQ